MSPPKKKAVQTPPTDRVRGLSPCVELSPRSDPGGVWSWVIVCRGCGVEQLYGETQGHIRDPNTTRGLFEVAHVECIKKWEALKDK